MKKNIKLTKKDQGLKVKKGFLYRKPTLVLDHNRPRLTEAQVVSILKSAISKKIKLNWSNGRLTDHSEMPSSMLSCSFQHYNMTVYLESGRVRHVSNCVTPKHQEFNIKSDPGSPWMKLSDEDKIKFESLLDEDYSKGEK